MKSVLVRVNGSLASALGASRMIVQLPDPATLGDLVAELGEQHPSCREYLSRAVAMVGGKHLSPSAVLTEEQEIALLMPIAGG